MATGIARDLTARPVKPWGCHDDNFVVTGGDEGCRNNFLYRLWRQSCHHDNSRVREVWGCDARTEILLCLVFPFCNVRQSNSTVLLRYGLKYCPFIYTWEQNWYSPFKYISVQLNLVTTDALAHESNYSQQYSYNPIFAATYNCQCA